MISEGWFREDFFYWLNEFLFYVLFLKDCGEDIMLLVGFFFFFVNEELEKEIRGFDWDVREVFVFYLWFGNICELKNVVRCVCVLV